MILVCYSSLIAMGVIPRLFYYHYYYYLIELQMGFYPVAVLLQ
jgi:hypothetical protein